MERRLAAILAADMAGYSKLMAGDEAGTISRQKKHRADLIDPKIAQYSGRIVKTTGDGMLVEFASVVDAVQCAIEIQRAMREREADLPDDKRIAYRIGINMGDIVIDGEDILGNGVNVAARLEGVAQAGGLCLSDVVYQNVQDKLPLDFEDMGHLSLKNIDRKVRAWKWREGSARLAPRHAPADREQSLSLPDKPSVAVLPFENLSSDPEQEFFADGIAEDIITELSKFRSLFVIARNSSFAFKGQSLNVKEISRKLGVRYIVEGSVRRAGNRVRVTAQLIDADDDKHIWAERFDRDLEDIFAVQDEVTLAIVTAIEPQLGASERVRALRKPPESLDAWENYQRGLWHSFQYKGEDYEKTLVFFERAIELDPAFSSAYAGLGYAIYLFIILGASPDRERDLQRAFEASRTAVQLDDRNPFALVALTRGYLLRREHETAILVADKAIELNPNLALAHFGRAHALWHSGRPADALASHDEAMRLSPHDPMLWAFMASKAIALLLLGRFEEASELSRKSQQEANAAIFSHLAEISALGHLGRKEEARIALEKAFKVKSDLSISYISEALPITDPKCREVFLGGFRKAGLAQ